MQLRVSINENIIQHNLVVFMKLQLRVVSLISLLPFWRGVFGGQIFPVDDVLGRMSTPRTVSKPEVSESVKRTPGKLRGVVENSGVCGWFLLPLLFNSTYEMAFFRDDSWSLPSFRIW
jgi:hypothetical protein